MVVTWKKNGRLQTAKVTVSAASKRGYRTFRVPSGYGTILVDAPADIRPLDLLAAVRRLKRR